MTTTINDLAQEFGCQPCDVREFACIGPSTADTQNLPPWEVKVIREAWKLAPPGPSADFDDYPKRGF